MLALGRGREIASVESVDRDSSTVCGDIVRKTAIGMGEEVSTAPGDAWYSEAAKVFPLLVNSDISRTSLRQSLIVHALQSLSEEDTTILLNSTPGSCDVEQGIATYYGGQFMHAGESKGLLVQKEGNLELLVQRGDDVWRRADSEDKREFVPMVVAAKDAVVPTIDKCGDLVGFMSSWKKDHVVFKIRMSAQKRNKGARCDQSNKSTLLKYLHQLGYPQFGDDSSRGRISLCVLIELLLRHMNIDKVRGQRWFLTPAEAVLSME